MAQLILNFDVIILLLLVFCTLKGAIRGVFGQIRSTFMIAVPLIVLFIMHGTILDSLQGIEVYKSVVGILYKGLKYVFNLRESYLFALFTYMVVFAVISFVIYLIFQLIAPSRKHQILSEKKTASRVIGGILGGINGYLCIFILFFVLHSVASFDVTTGITKIFFNFHKELLLSLMS